MKTTIALSQYNTKQFMTNKFWMLTDLVGRWKGGIICSL